MTLVLCLLSGLLLVLAGACLWLFHTLTLERAVRAAQSLAQPAVAPLAYPAAPGASPASALTYEEMQALAEADTDADLRKAESDRYLEELRAEFPELVSTLALEKEQGAQPARYE